MATSWGTTPSLRFTSRGFFRMLTPSTWISAAVGVMAGFCQAGGVGLCIAEWMVEGEPERDVFAADVARFGRLVLHFTDAREVLDPYRQEPSLDQMVLIGHSMGGLVARACMRRYGAKGVAKLIALGSPHHGTRLARFGPGRNAQLLRGHVE